MKHRNKILYGSALLLSLFLIFSCSTVPPSKNPNRIGGLIKELNTASEDRLVELSSLPFLLDGEIIVREQDLRTLWHNLRSAGFTFAEADVKAVTPVDPSSYLKFGDNKEVQAFFKKYVAKDSAVAEIQTKYGTFLIITGGRNWFIPKISVLPDPRGVDMTHNLQRTVIVTLLSILTGTFAAAQNTEVTYLEGNPKLRNSSGALSALDYGSELRTGESVITGKADQAELSQGDLATIRVRPNTVLPSARLNRGAKKSRS